MKISGITSYKLNSVNFKNGSSLNQSIKPQNFGAEEKEPDPNKLEKNKVLYIIAFIAAMAVGGFYGVKKGWFTRNRPKAIGDSVEVKPNSISALVPTLADGLEKIKANNQILLDKDFLLAFGRRAYDGYDSFSGSFWRALNEATPLLPESNKADVVTQMFHLKKYEGFEINNTLSIYRKPDGEHRNPWAIIEKQIEEVFI